MNNDILDKTEQEESYYDKSLGALKWGGICIVSLLVIGAVSFYVSVNEVVSYVLSLLFLFILLGGLLAFGLYGFINGIISIWEKEDYGIVRIVVLIACFLLFIIPFCLTMMFIIAATPMSSPN